MYVYVYVWCGVEMFLFRIIRTERAFFCIFLIQLHNMKHLIVLSSIFLHIFITAFIFSFSFALAIEFILKSLYIPIGFLGFRTISICKSFLVQLFLFLSIEICSHTQRKTDQVHIFFSCFSKLFYFLSSFSLQDQRFTILFFL